MVCFSLYRGSVLSPPVSRILRFSLRCMALWSALPRVHDRTFPHQECLAFQSPQMINFDPGSRLPSFVNSLLKCLVFHWKIGGQYTGVIVIGFELPFEVKIAIGAHWIIGVEIGSSVVCRMF